MRKIATDAEPVAPFTFSQPDDRDYSRYERQVTVTNPDGSTTTHRYWSGEPHIRWSCISHMVTDCPTCLRRSRIL